MYRLSVAWRLYACVLNGSTTLWLEWAGVSWSGLVILREQGLQYAAGFAVPMLTS